MQGSPLTPSEVTEGVKVRLLVKNSGKVLKPGTMEMEIEMETEMETKIKMEVKEMIYTAHVCMGAVPVLSHLRLIVPVACSAGCRIMEYSESDASEVATSFLPVCRRPGKYLLKSVLPILCYITIHYLFILLNQCKP